MPSPVLFATGKPSSKADAAILNRWITDVLDRYAEKMAAGEEESTSLNQRVDELVPILSLGLHELTRQVSKECAERGVVLEKIWRTYVELFDRSLKETRALLRFHKARSQRVSEALDETHEALAEVKQKLPSQMDKLHQTLSSKFAHRSEELESLLKSTKKENAAMEQLIEVHKDATKSWFPSFEKYSGSSHRVILQGACAELPSSTTPESRMAADFKRILLALPPEARRKIGFYVSSLLGIRGTELVDNGETVESLSDRIEHNTWKIGVMEEKIKALQERQLQRDSRRQSGVVPDRTQDADNTSASLDRNKGDDDDPLGPGFAPTASLVATDSWPPTHPLATAQQGQRLHGDRMPNKRTVELAPEIPATETG
jgi:hypothetical protein